MIWSILAYPIRTAGVERHDDVHLVELELRDTELELRATELELRARSEPAAHRAERPALGPSPPVLWALRLVRVRVRRVG